MEFTPWFGAGISIPYKPSNIKVPLIIGNKIIWLKLKIGVLKYGSPVAEWIKYWEI